MRRQTQPWLVKIGGSLLDWEGLASAWRKWSAERPAGVCFWLVAGGGAWVDSIRDQQARRGWSDREAHELAIDAMALTARVLAHRLALGCDNLLGESCSSTATTRDAFVGDRQSEPAISSDAGADRVVNVVPWLKRVESRAPGPKLPVGWSTTSDSIAARVAQQLGDLPLVLAKSCDPPGVDWRTWVETGYVDPSFALYGSGLSQMRAINFRAYGDISEPFSLGGG
ncbi:MAG: hypothetical protein U0795_08340 [Pirellulales bacterium]